MKYPQVLYQYPDQAGKPFRPSNGTEGMTFFEFFCDQCYHDRNHDCDILARSMAFNIDEDEYPKEWVYSDEGWPICTNYQHWDGSDGDDPPEPDDPNQLCFNFIFDEILEELEVVHV